jgi:hypothetical protein
MGAKKVANREPGNVASLGFAQTLWLAADKLRNHLDAAEYKHVVLELMATIIAALRDTLLPKLLSSGIRVANAEHAIGRNV